MTSRLTSADHAWPRRIPTSVITVGAVLTLAAIIAVSIVTPGGNVGDVRFATSWRLFVDDAANGVTIAAVLGAVYAPRLCGWLIALTLQPWFAMPLDSPVYRALYWLWPALMALDLVLVLRQRGWPWAVGSPGRQLSLPRRPSIGRRVIVALLVVGLLVPAAVYAHERGQVRALHDRAVSDVGVVTSQSRADGTVRMRVHRKTYDFYVNDVGAYSVGSSHEVYVDPLGKARPYGPDDADPAGWDQLGVLSGLLALCALGVGPLTTWRRRELARLARADEPAIEMLARWHPVSNGLLVWGGAGGAGRGSVFLLPDVSRMDTATHLGRVDAHRGSRRPTPLGSLVDAVMMLVGLVVEPSSILWPVEAANQQGRQHFASAMPVAVRGLRGDGSLAIVEDVADGSVWTTPVPARDPRTVRSTWASAWRRGVGRHLDALDGRLRAGGLDEETQTDGVPPAGEHVSAQTRAGRPWSPLVDAFWRAAAVTSRIGPFVAIAAAWFVVRFLATPDPGDGRPSWLHLAPVVLTIGELCTAWWYLHRPTVLAEPYGLRLTGQLVDTLIPARRIGHVHVDDRHLTVELIDPGDEIEIYPSDRDDDSRRHDLELLESTLDQARAAGASAPLFPYAPHAGTAIGLLALVTVVAAWFSA